MCLVASITLMVLGIYWPEFAQRIFIEPAFIFLIALWCGLSAVLLHSELMAGLVRGMREFRKACRELNDDRDDF